MPILILVYGMSEYRAHHCSSVERLGTYKCSLGLFSSILYIASCLLSFLCRFPPPVYSTSFERCIPSPSAATMTPRPPINCGPRLNRLLQVRSTRLLVSMRPVCLSSSILPYCLSPPLVHYIVQTSLISMLTPYVQ